MRQGMTVQELLEAKKTCEARMLSAMVAAAEEFRAATGATIRAVDANFMDVMAMGDDDLQYVLCGVRCAVASWEL